MDGLTWPGIIALALADSVNPCALAVLFMILVAIMMYNPNKKTKVLGAGLAFVLSVFVMYLIYGAVIITLFAGLRDVLKEASTYVYTGFGFVAIALGLLGIKDYISYRPGTFGTEMPLMLRPKVKKMLGKVTSVKGAAVAGIFVTLFLLPCTIGPYLIFGNLVSQTLLVGEKVKMIVQSFPMLVVYNLIFVLPMLVVTSLVYFGVASVRDAQQWKDRNIRILHLVAGLILLGLGMAMVFGWL